MTDLNDFCWYKERDGRPCGLNRRTHGIKADGWPIISHYFVGNGSFAPKKEGDVELRVRPICEYPIGYTMICGRLEVEGYVTHKMKYGHEFFVPKHKKQMITFHQVNALPQELTVEQMKDEIRRRFEKSIASANELRILGNEKAPHMPPGDDPRSGVILVPPAELPLWYKLLQLAVVIAIIVLFYLQGTGRL